MRKSFALVLAVLLFGVVGAAVLAQTHNNMTEKKVSDEITLSSDTRVGTHLLKAGRYRVQCDTKTIRFSLITTDIGQGGFSSMTKVLETPCQGKELPAKRERTELSLPKGTDGVTVLEKLYLRGSNIEHVFPN